MNKQLICGAALGVAVFLPAMASADGYYDRPPNGPGDVISTAITMPFVAAGVVLNTAAALATAPFTGRFEGPLGPVFNPPPAPAAVVVAPAPRPSYYYAPPAATYAPAPTAYYSQPAPTYYSQPAPVTYAPTTYYYSRPAPVVYYPRPVYQPYYRAGYYGAPGY